MKLHVHVTPKSGKDEVSGWRGAELQVRVTAAPEAGKATAAVCRVVADALKLSKSSVTVSRGETSRHKVLEVDADEEQVYGVLGRPDEALF